jgi:hypothetical protein
MLYVDKTIFLHIYTRGRQGFITYSTQLQHLDPTYSSFQPTKRQNKILSISMKKKTCHHVKLKVSYRHEIKKNEHKYVDLYFSFLTRI